MRRYNQGLEKPMSQNMPDLSGLGIAEKLQLVEDLWDEIASRPEMIPIHTWQKEELTRRKAARDRDPDAGLTWEEAKAKARGHRG
jgi:putative addiction module component (TIGR02574 family)